MVMMVMMMMMMLIGCEGDSGDDGDDGDVMVMCWLCFGNMLVMSYKTCVYIYIYIYDSKVSDTLLGPKFNRRTSRSGVYLLLFLQLFLHTYTWSAALTTGSPCTVVC